MTNKNPYDFLEIKDLPRLPIPPLKETCDQYLELLQPLVGKKEYEITKRNVNDFLKEDGPELDKDLHLLAEKTSTSWLEGFWDTSYLTYRAPNPINVNPFFSFSETPDMSQLGRASKITNSFLKFYQMVRNNKFKYDYERDMKLCMTQYFRLFGTTRIPYIGRDKLKTYTKSNYMIVLCNNHMWKVQVLSSDLKEIASAEQLKRHFNYIMENSQEINNDGISIMTSENRDTWANFRSNLIDVSEINKTSISTVDGAIFVLCLDTNNTSTDLEVALSLLHNNTGENRWFDKLQLVVTPSGVAGWNMEHSPMDGHTILQTSTRIYNDLTGKEKFPSPSNNDDEGLIKYMNSEVQPVELHWELNEELLCMLHEASNNMLTLISKTETCVLKFKHYGKNFIKKQKMSPDAYVQQAYQLAYWRLTHKKGSTYESVLTKNYYHGRTECARGVSVESDEFCRAFTHENNEGNQHTAEEKLNLLKRATVKHVKTMKLCKKGAGVDRHFYGLYCIAKQKQVSFPNYELPAIFSDPSYSLYSSSVLSTSHCGGDSLDLFGFGPVVPTGLGIGYMIKPDSINIVVTSFIQQAKPFVEHLVNVFLDLENTCLKVNSNNSNVKQTTKIRSRL